MSEVKLNLFQKISAVMKDVAYLKKDDHIQFNNTNYKAISEEKVTSTIRQSLIEHGLIIIPIEQAHKKEGNLSTVDTKYKIIDVDTGEHEIIVSSGTGADSQDKGVGKAMTYSYKYLLLRTFAIPTGEDPDKISSAELDAKEAAEREKLKAPITSKQAGDIKLKSLELAQLCNKKEADVYKALNITDVAKLNNQEAINALSKLNGWINNAKKAAKEEMK